MSLIKTKPLEEVLTRELQSSHRLERSRPG